MHNLLFIHYYEDMKNKRPLIAPSVLSADFAHMERDIHTIMQSGGDFVHLDVMDGQFVPNLTFGPKMISDIREITDLPFDAHLMVETPERLIPKIAEAGADYITFHYEAAVHVHRIIQEIRNLDKHPGISIVPSTPASDLDEILPFVDLILIMTVNPGFGGQQLIPKCLDKVAYLVQQRENYDYDYIISVDGGVNTETAPAIRDAGTDLLVTGSAFFSSDDPAQELRDLRNFWNT